MTQVRLAVPDDADAITEMVAAAFATDPGWSYMTYGENHSAMRAFARALLIPRIRRGTAWVSDDNMAVAMWDRRASDLPADPDHDERWAAFRAEVGDAIANRIDLYDAAVAAAGPARPYWYLGVLATHPSAQGRGLATAVLQPGLAAASAEGWDCWLETSSSGNKAFYAGRGFADGHAIDLPGAPTTWWLRRRP